MSPSSKLVNPKFAGIGSNNFHLQVSSPAIDNGLAIGWVLDLDNVAVPQNLVPDRGAYEYGLSGAMGETPPLVLDRVIYLPAITNNN